MAIVREFGNVSLLELLRNTGYREQNVQEVVDEARDNESREEGHLVDSGSCEGNSSTSCRGKSVVELLRSFYCSGRTGTSKTDNVDENARNISSICAEVDSVSVPVPTILVRVIQICDIIVASSNNIVFGNLGE